MAEARKSQETRSELDIGTAFARFDLKPVPDKVLTDMVLPMYSSSGAFVGSTDLGTVSDHQRAVSHGDFRRQADRLQLCAAVWLRGRA
ncbi:hypothetical protein GCM10007928_41840 [Sulfitobacter porphyrae]|nr:hypothetical protein GCM10007928_41840 [Sulfitobacter porphyrae]